MHDGVNILTKRQTPTPPAAAGRRRRHITLPPQLLETARRRLGYLAGLFAAFAILDLVVAIDLARGENYIIIADLAGFVLGIIVLSLAFWRRVPTSLVLNIGLPFEVVLCFIISLAWTFFYADTFGMVPLMDFTTVVIILFPLVVPTPPLKQLIASLAAATAPPLSVALLGHLGVITLQPFPFPGAAVDPVVAVAWTPALAVIFAWFASCWVYGLGTDVARALELGSYSLENLLGQGGMGEVWRAKHRMLARPAAVKLVSPAALGGDPAAIGEAQARFEREAQITAELQSPHTVKLYDYGTTEDGRLYYVMELLEGIDLDELVQRFGPLPAERVVYILRQACESLSEAHRRGLVHRDIKPGNIFLCQHAFKFDVVKLLDFGLAKHTQLSSDDVRLSRAETIHGSPAYMAPEVALGQEALDGRADIYGLGCVAYWLLTGQLVFDALSPTAMIVAHVKDQPAPPSRRSELFVPAEIDELILACLAKDRAARVASADNLASALAGIRLANPWTPERAAKWWRTHGLARVSPAFVPPWS